MANVVLCDEVTEILQRSEIGENLLVLPPEQLDRKLYERVAKAIAAAGGKWNRSKRGFLFSSDPRQKLGLALESGTVVDEKKLRQAFYTPEEIAHEVAVIACVENRIVLEPSAGDGALARACVRFGASHVLCFEIEESCRQTLRKLPKVSVMIRDFLAVKPLAKMLFDRIVMNPPFTKSQYVRHVAHAKTFLAPGGQLFAIVPDNDCKKLAALGAVEVRKFDGGAFRESGTNVRTRLVRVTA